MATNKKKGQHKKEFEINNIDPMGQGVCKREGRVMFIGKTLPGETGTAEVVKTRKGVSFARLLSIDKKSDKRVEPLCDHYADCPGCHYLHTSYEEELKYKVQALQSQLHLLAIDENFIEVVAAPERLGYRNRIQLHYRHKYIGLVDSLSDQIIEIPRCQIIRKELVPEFEQLYVDKSWAREHKGGGHCELYLKNGEVSICWNGEYAHGGFTQVYEEMNRQLCQIVMVHLQQIGCRSLLDLFCGNGNLTNGFVHSTESHRTMVDFMANDLAGYIQLDLFDEQSLKIFQSKYETKQFDTVIVDPPRKGFPLLGEWIGKYQPKHLVYVSCNAATMARDLQSLGQKYNIERLLLIDMFPSTWHFETVALISLAK